MEQTAAIDAFSALAHDTRLKIFRLLVQRGPGGTPAMEIGRLLDIKPSTLSGHLAALKRAGLVTSKRGPKGGYALALPSDEVRLGDIIRAVEGPIVLTSSDAHRPGGDATSRQITEEAFADLGRSIEGCLDAMSLADLCARGEAEGVRRKPPRRYVYSI